MRPGLHPRRSCARQHGVTLVELMISMTIGLLVVGVATVLLVSVKTGYVVQSDSAQILDTGRHAIDILVRTVRQASYHHWDSVEAGTLDDIDEPAVFGMDAKSLKSRSEGIATPVARSINGSDVLAVRFGGSGAGSNGDGSVLNCAGFPVGSGTPKDKGKDTRGWSIFYVAEDASGEPELYCKYPGEEGWASQAIARGVESFQVLYGLDTDGDGLPNSLANATGIESMSKNAKDGQAPWKNVVEVKVAVLVRGGNPVPLDIEGRYFDLFGEPYSLAHAGRDRGVRIRVAELPKADRNLARKVFVSSIWLRNRAWGK